MVTHEVAQNAAVGRRLAQRGKCLVGIGGGKSPPDRLVLLDIVLPAKLGDGIAGDQLVLDQIVEEAVNDADLVQQRLQLPAHFDFPQPRLEHLSVNYRMTTSNELETAEYGAISAAAASPEPGRLQKVLDDRQIGIVPGAHDSTSDPGTSSATARRSSVASLR